MTAIPKDRLAEVYAIELAACLAARMPLEQAQEHAAHAMAIEQVARKGRDSDEPADVDNLPSDPRFERLKARASELYGLAPDDYMRAWTSVKLEYRKAHAKGKRWLGVAAYRVFRSIRAAELFGSTSGWIRSQFSNTKRRDTELFADACAFAEAMIAERTEGESTDGQSKADEG